MHRVDYDAETKARAKNVAKLIVAYPIIYVICTLPLVIARLMSMAGREVTFVQLCIAGAMITSNGWLDVERTSGSWLSFK